MHAHDARLREQSEMGVAGMVGGGVGGGWGDHAVVAGGHLLTNTGSLDLLTNTGSLGGSKNHTMLKERGGSHLSFFDTSQNYEFALIVPSIWLGGGGTGQLAGTSGMKGKGAAIAPKWKTRTSKIFSM